MKQMVKSEIFAPPFRQVLTGRELLPGSDYGKTDAEVLRFVRERCDSYHHQVGSCKMGQDEMSVVDPHLRVHGVGGLRVADASIMPTIVTGNIHTGILMIAEKCADMVKNTHGL
jgi:choline dehydrogenase